MYAITFELTPSPTENDDRFNSIQSIMVALGFKQIQKNIYVTGHASNPLVCVYQAINTLSNIDWLTQSLKSIYSFQMQELSNFTKIVKNESP